MKNYLLNDIYRFLKIEVKSRWKQIALSQQLWFSVIITLIFHDVTITNEFLHFVFAFSAITFISSILWLFSLFSIINTKLVKKLIDDLDNSFANLTFVFSFGLIISFFSMISLLLFKTPISIMIIFMFAYVLLQSLTMSLTFIQVLRLYVKSLK